MLKDQCPCSQSLWECESEPGFTLWSIWLQIQLSTLPLHVPSLNFTVGSMDISAISLLLLWGSLPTPEASQKAIKPASDLLPLIGFPTAMVPFQPVHGLLLSPQNRVPGDAGSQAAGHLSHLFLMYCQPKLLTSDISVIQHLPWLLLSPAFQSISEISKSQCGNSRQHQGRAETLSVRLTNWDVGKIPPRLI